MRFEFVSPVDRALFDATAEAWRAQVASNPENTSESYYEAGLSSCEGSIDGADMTGFGGGCLCAVRDSDTNEVAALLIVSHAKVRQSLKMLNLYVQPRLNVADSEPNYAELAWIAATAIVGCLGLTYDDYPAKELKILTSFPLDRQFMTAIGTAVLGANPKTADLEVGGHGNWLVVTKKSADK